MQSSHRRLFIPQAGLWVWISPCGTDNSAAYGKKLLKTVLMSVRYRTRSLPCKLFKSFLKKNKTKQNKTCTSLSNGSICIGNQIILVQFGINKQKTNNLWSLKKLTSACLFQIAREKSCDYVLIIYMEKYEMAYHN